MLEIVQFENGKYGIRNLITGMILNKKGDIREFKTINKANNYMRKLNHSLVRTLARLQNY